MHDLKVFIFKTECAKQFQKLEKQSKCKRLLKSGENCDNQN